MNIGKIKNLFFKWFGKTTKIYLHSHGNDKNDGLSMDSPKRTWKETTRICDKKAGFFNRYDIIVMGPHSDDILLRDYVSIQGIPKREFLGDKKDG